MAISHLLMLSLVSVAVAGRPSDHVNADSQSSINLTTSFDHVNVESFTWFFKTKQENYRIIKIQNGRLVENLNNRYKPSFHGTILRINNLTKKDSGNYTAEITMWDTYMDKEHFEVTVVDPVSTPQIIYEGETTGNQCHVTLNCSISSTTEVKSNTISIVIGVVAVALLMAVSFWVTWRKKKSSEQDNQTDGVKTRQYKKTVEEDENAKNKNEEYLENTVQPIDDQDKGEAEENENEKKENENRDEQQNEDNLTRPVQEIGNHKVWAQVVYENEVKKHNKEDEHWNKSEERENLLQRTKPSFPDYSSIYTTRNLKVWTTPVYEKEVRKHDKEYQHWNNTEYRKVQLQETSDLDDRVRKDEMKDDHENDEGHSLVQ
ncbi:uncharacterized protein ACNLHF_003721 isoform 1-T4 [Anomaloglossus baeobatrachus]|uniref:uncharacterized protein LOC142257766 n=1 Tax=Anomaloglossus baeobatrachus TaxID=238106 RepID=UPI003F4F4FE2